MLAFLTGTGLATSAGLNAYIPFLLVALLAFWLAQPALLGVAALVAALADEPGDDPVAAARASFRLMTRPAPCEHEPNAASFPSPSTM